MVDPMSGPTDHLKRIEERHSPATDGQTCRVCDYSPEPPEPCDVVKLARALDSFMESKVLRQRFDHSGFMNATALVERDHYLKLRREAERTLEEVAGVGDE